MNSKISESTKIRADKVGYHVDETQAGDGTYWIPSIGHWRSIEQIENEIASREERSSDPAIN